MFQGEPAAQIGTQTKAPRSNGDAAYLFIFALQNACEPVDVEYYRDFSHWTDKTQFILTPSTVFPSSDTKLIPVTGRSQCIKNGTFFPELRDSIQCNG